MKEALSQAGIKFAYLDVTESMRSLGMFLKYRDTMEEFIPIKEAGRVGMPSIIINDGEKVIFELPENLDELR